MLNLNLKKWTSFIHMVFEMTKENKKLFAKITYLRLNVFLLNVCIVSL